MNVGNEKNNGNNRNRLKRRQWILKNGWSVPYRPTEIRVYKIGNSIKFNQHTGREEHWFFRSFHIFVLASDNWRSFFLTETCVEENSILKTQWQIILKEIVSSNSYIAEWFILKKQPLTWSTANKDVVSFIMIRNLSYKKT